MKPTLKQTFVLLLLAACLALVVGGCATANGFGKDMEGAGQDIQHGTK